ncbi:MAG TPA: hypothetical protein VMF55_03035 [Solirubrobacterales bacterium]|nr:hypothetical protein [Solirubrobacterales bacterium]
MNRFRLLALLLLTTGLTIALSITAGAALPKPGNTLIVPAKSIGDVSLGSTSTEVTKAWGKNAACELTCDYAGATKGGGIPAQAVANLEQSGGTPYVATIYVEVGTTGGASPKPDFDTRLTRFATSKGIHLGSTVKELTAAYRGLNKEHDPAVDLYTLKGPKESATVFTVVEGRVTEILIEAHPRG